MENKLDILVLLIDPQNDFIDRPNHLIRYTQLPALPIQGAFEDSIRTARFINDCKHVINNIIVSLDSHHQLDSRHHTNWRTDTDAVPPPFIDVTMDDVVNGKLRIINNDHPPARIKAYLMMHLEELEKTGQKYTLYPPHCIIGTYGHTILEEINAAIRDLEVFKGKPAKFIHKGENIWTESYSAVFTTWKNSSTMTISTSYIKH